MTWKTSIFWKSAVSVLVVIAIMAPGGAGTPRAVSTEVFESINQETGEGWYYWDPRIERFVRVNKTLQVMDPRLAGIYRRIYHLEVIVRKVHPNEQGFAGP